MKSFLSISLTIIGLAIGIFAISTPQKFKISDSYSQLWHTVDSLKQKQLTRSALEVIEVILEKSNADKNDPQRLKALIHKLALETTIEDQVFTESLTALEEEAKNATFPLKNMLHSMLGEIYWHYFQQNQWTYLERTQVLNNTSKDPLTWDLPQILATIDYHERKSLENIQGLQSISIAQFQDIITIQEGSSDLRPTLFDFIAHRALDIYKNPVFSVNKPAEQYQLDQIWHIAPAIEFSEHTKENDSSFVSKALGLYQDLVSFHIKDLDQKALIDVDLSRLEWVYSQSTLEDKQWWYMESLRNAETTYSNLPMSTKITYILAQQYQQRGQKNDLKKAFEVCSNAITKHPDSKGAKNCQALQAQIAQPSLSIQAEQVVLPQEPTLLKIDLKNTDRVFFKIIKLNFKDYKNSTERQNTQQIIGYLNNIKTFKTWDLHIHNPENYETQSIETAIEPLETGFYLVLASSNPDFSYQDENVSFLPLWVSNLSSINRPNLNQIQVLHRNTGLPIEKATVVLYQRNYSYKSSTYEQTKIGEYITDNKGLVNLKKRENNYESYSYDIQTKDDYLNVGQFYSQYHSNEKEEAYEQTFFFTDRSIYRPGQIIYFKGIVIESQGKENKILPNFETTITLYDVNFQEVSKIDVKTNEFGSYQGSFVLPTGLLNGQMRLEDEETNSQTYFSVEEYKRPTFEITFDSLKESFKLNQTIALKGKAMSYAGAPLDGAKAKYRITRNARFMPYYQRYCFIPQVQETEIKSGEVTCNDKGEFVIDFTALADPSISEKLSPQFNFTITVDVTDINGETQSRETSITVAYEAMNIEVQIPELLLKNTNPNIHIKTTNKQGMAIPAQAHVEIYPLSIPHHIYKKRYWENPDSMYHKNETLMQEYGTGKEDDETTWAKEKAVLSMGINTAQTSSINIPDLKNWKSGRYLLIAKSKDAYGKEVITQSYFTLFSEQDKSIPTQKVLWTYIPDKSYEPLDQAHILIGSADKNTQVHYILYKDEQILESKTLSLSQELKSIDIPILESYRGNVFLKLYTVKNNRYYEKSLTLLVPYSNKELSISTETWRNKLLPGEKETLTLSIKGKKGEKIASELLAGMYDASLDALKPHHWNFSLFSHNYGYLNLESEGFSVGSHLDYRLNSKQNFNNQKIQEYDKLNWSGLDFWTLTSQNRGGRIYFAVEQRAPMSMTSYSVTRSEKNLANAKLDEVIVRELPSEVIEDKDAEIRELATEVIEKKHETKAQPLRKNFQETAFFFPQLKTNENGNVSFSFQIPDALTEWKFMALAHTAELAVGQYENTLQTQKPLMIVPNMPRFVRQGDHMSVMAKINNLSGENMSGTASLEFFDPVTNQILTGLFPTSNQKVYSPETKQEVHFKSEKDKNAVVKWEIKIPDDVQILGYRIKAIAGQVSDGEENVLPVLSNRMLVTESMPLPIRGLQSKTFVFDKLKNNTSSTLKHHNYTVEFTSNPVWYVVQSIPYMAEYPYECSEQLFSRFYANSLASHIVEKKPAIKTVLDIWGKTEPSAFLSNLEKNQALKSALLEETPWVLEAQDQNERQKRVSLLFDLNKLKNEQVSTLKKLKDNQLDNGAWPWFKGMDESRYITQYVTSGLGHLQKLGITNPDPDMIRRACFYLDSKLEEDYRNLKKYTVDLSKVEPNGEQIQYFYARSFFKEIMVDASAQKAHDFYYAQIKTYWTRYSPYMQGMIALTAHRKGDTELAQDIIKALRENAVFSEELGMYYKNTAGYYWHQAPIEQQALLIEVFDEVAKDTKSVEELQIWLLKNKQTNDWKTTRATSEACYALLLRGNDALQSTQVATVTVGNTNLSQKLENQVQAATSYFSLSWDKNEIKPELATISIQNPNQYIAWGAAYWQYFEDLDKITPHETPVKLSKKLYRKINTTSGATLEDITEQTPLKIGDKLTVRIEVKTDRDLEFMHLKDMRASAFEPIEAISGYKYQDGIDYYQCIKDASMNFFFDRLPKGTYVFEYELKVTHAGQFSNGISSLQCMYAPEFGAHSEGIRVNIVAQ